MEDLLKKLLQELLGQEILKQAGGLEISIPAAIFSLFLVGLIMAGLIVDAMLVGSWRSRPGFWSAAVQNLRARPWRWPEGLTVLLVCGSLILTSVLGEPPPATAEARSVAPPWPAMVLQTLLFPSVGFSLIITFMFFRKTSLSEAFGIQRGEFWKRARQGVLCYVGALPILVAVSLVYK